MKLNNLYNMESKYSLTQLYPLWDDWFWNDTALYRYNNPILVNRLDMLNSSCTILKHRLIRLMLD